MAGEPRHCTLVLPHSLSCPFCAVRQACIALQVQWHARCVRTLCTSHRSTRGRRASFLLHAGIGSDGLGGFAACDNFHSTVRRVDAAGTISTIAGNGVGVSGGTTGNGGPAMAVRLNRPYAIFGDPATASIVILGKEGDLVDESLDSHAPPPPPFVDSANSALRRIYPSNLTFASANVAGTGTAGSSGTILGPRLHCLHARLLDRPHLPLCRRRRRGPAGAVEPAAGHGFGRRRRLADCRHRKRQSSANILQWDDRNSAMALDMSCLACCICQILAHRRLPETAL